MSVWLTPEGRGGRGGETDFGSKPMLKLLVAGREEFMFLPLKSKAYKLSWLKNIFW